MHKRFIAVLGGAVVVVVAIVGGVYWGFKSTDRDELIIYGNVDIRKVDLGFRVTGRIREMRFEEGDCVKEGQIMAVLDKDTFEADVHSARGQMQAQEANLRKMEKGNRPEEIEQARASLNEKEVRFKNVHRLYQRRLSLEQSGAISKQQYDDTLADRDAAEAQEKLAEASLALQLAGFREEDVQQARANLETARARLTQAEISLQDTEITSPADGIILTRVREPGAIVSAGQTVYTLQLPSPVWVRTYVAERDLGRIYQGMPADVYTDSQPAKPYHGQIGFISPVAEFTPKNVETKDLRTDLVYRLRVIVDSPDNGLRQGMPVTVKLQLKPNTPAQAKDQ
jgi:HlyD family secretion protein